jgi:hypothetical protein
MDAKRISLVSGAALLALTATASAGPINVANSYYGHYACDGAPYGYYGHRYYGGPRYDWIGGDVIHVGGTSHRG